MEDRVWGVGCSAAARAPRLPHAWLLGCSVWGAGCSAAARAPHLPHAWLLGCGVQGMGSSRVWGLEVRVTASPTGLLLQFG